MSNALFIAVAWLVCHSAGLLLPLWPMLGLLALGVLCDLCRAEWMARQLP